MEKRKLEGNEKRKREDKMGGICDTCLIDMSGHFMS